MRKNLLEKLKESAQSVVPISLIVFALHFTIAPMPLGTLALFITGTILLIIGMAMFSLGSDMAMMPIGEHIGAGLTRSRKAWVLLVGSFLLGVVVTVAEPDLQVLTKQVPSVPDLSMILVVALGVGIFLMLALLRIVLRAKLSHMFLVLYGLVFVVAAFVGSDYLAVAFDAGGVTTGPITVPFILALGAGVSAVRGGSSSEEDSFGLCALCSIGPVLAMLILGMFFDSSGAGYAYETPGAVGSFGELTRLFSSGFIEFLQEVAMALLPIAVIFGLYQTFRRKKLPGSQIIKIGVGLVYTVIGLSIFLAGVNIGFMPAGQYLGGAIAALDYKWVLIPLSIVIGFFVVMAEPAVHVLNKQVEEITSGAISNRMMMFGLSAGVSSALALAMIRIMAGISIWFFLLPGYLAALILTFFVPDIFTAIAFDSGGVASGSMAAAFLLPFALGVCEALGGNIMTDAFGIIAMIAMMPLVTLQIIGLIYKIKLRKAGDVDMDTPFDAADGSETETDDDMDAPDGAEAGLLETETKDDLAELLLLEGENAAEES